MYSTPGISHSNFSIGLVTRSSTSCAEAPGIWTKTSTMGTTICGSSSRGSFHTAKTPSNSDPTITRGVSFDLIQALANLPAKPRICSLFMAVPVLFGASANQPPGLLNDLLDISSDFHDYTNTYFLADRLLGFDPVKGEGTVVWRRNELAPRIAFSNMEAVLRTFGGNTFPDREYAVDPALPFSIQFVSPRTVRIRMKTGVQVRPDAPSLMLVGDRK